MPLAGEGGVAAAALGLAADAVAALRVVRPLLRVVGLFGVVVVVVVVAAVVSFAGAASALEGDSSFVIVVTEEGYTGRKKQRFSSLIGAQSEDLDGLGFNGGGTNSHTYKNEKSADSVAATRKCKNLVGLPLPHSKVGIMLEIGFMLDLESE